MSLLAALLLAQAQPVAAAPPAATPPAAFPTREGDVVLKDFRFADGQTLPALKIHYTTLGTPRRDAKGAIVNAVMVLHGTGGSGKQFLSPQFANQLYGSGQPLDISRYYIILPDGIGHGASSKPSDGLKARFPAYDYGDMVEAQRRMLLEGLKVSRLRLLMGTSMGCMHGFVWAERHPDFAQAMMPLACLPVEIAGVNRMWRKLAIDGIRADPGYAGGNYSVQPAQGLRTAASLLAIAGAFPLGYQAAYPTRDKAEAFITDRVAADIARRDANDLIWQLEASRSYDPSPDLEKIRVPMTWINSADDFINPRNLGIAEAAAKRMPTARFILLPETVDTKGHGTHSWAVHWKAELADLLKRTEPR